MHMVGEAKCLDSGNTTIHNPRYVPGFSRYRCGCIGSPQISTDWRGAVLLYRAGADSLRLTANATWWDA